MDGVGEVNYRCALRKGYNIALRGKDKHLVVHYVYFECLEEFLGISCIIFRFDKLRYPGKLAVDFLTAVLAALIFPMRRNTVFRYAVHFPSPYLNLEGNGVSAHNRRMKRAIHIRLRS